MEDPPFWDTDIFMPKDESSHAPDNVIDEAEKEIEGFRRLCFIRKPLMNLLKVTLKELGNCMGFSQSDQLQQDTTRQADPSNKDKLANT